MSTLLLIPGGVQMGLWLALSLVFLFRFRLPVAVFLMIVAGAAIFPTKA